MSYFPVDGGGAVDSVAGKVGVVVLDTGDIIREGSTDVVMGSFSQGGDTPYQQIEIAEGPTVGSIPIRSGTGGTFRVAVPTLSAHPAQLQSVRNATTSKPQILALTGASTAADIVTALQAAFTP